MARDATKDTHHRAAMPTATHRRMAGCREVECEKWLKGWKTTVDERTDLGKRQAAYIRHDSGRRFIETKEGEHTMFVFYPEQNCFSTHLVLLERDPLFSVQRGLAASPRSLNGEDWKYDFNEEREGYKQSRRVF